MSKIIPFEALLPEPKLAGRIICPPYDVISSEEARNFVKGNPYSLLHITKAEIDLPPDVGEYDGRVYERAEINLNRFVEEGWLKRDERSIYIYRLHDKGHVQTGVVCAVSVDEYDNGLIKRHELTRKDKEDDRTLFSYTIDAHAEPVFLTFRTDKELKNMIGAQTAGSPLYDLTDNNNVRHSFWRAGRAGDFTRLFEKLDALYIADGHHRSASASRVRALKKGENANHTGNELYNFFPAVVFPSDEVRIYRYEWPGDPNMRPIADVSIEDVMELADRSGIMPPKSTWFAPKLASGLFVYTF